jgi:ribonuclease Y
MDPVALVCAVLAALLAVACFWLLQRHSSLNSTLAVSLSRVGSMEEQLGAAADRARQEAALEFRQRLADAREEIDQEAAVARSALRDSEESLRGRRIEVERSAQEVQQAEQRLEQRTLEVVARSESVDEERGALTELKEEAADALQKISGMSRGDARELLLGRVEEEARSEMAARLVAVSAEVTERAEATAKNIISMAIQRYAGQYVCERTVSVVPLASDELKGRIIGKEGRNIRAIEAATGVDIIVDDTPDCVLVSAYNPIRREVAKAALEVLLEDGRIHPTRIEAVVRKAEFDFHRVIRAAGDQAAHEVGISGIHPEILKLLGALKYRTSYGQNQWQHSLEVAFLSGMMAAELGLDETLARRAGLLHDIGKVMDQTAEGSHALIGAEFARQHGEDDLVVNAIASHHEEVAQKTIYDCLAQAADAISGARPGARRETMQSYSQRLSDLERISNSFPGVDRSYAVQAGREIRVLVENSQLSDAEAVLLSRDIALKIEREMAYPGQIKVTVIRETRVVQYAR